MSESSDEWTYRLNALGTWNIEDRHRLIGIVERAGHARIIAVAPKMLAALQAMLNHSCVADNAAEDKDEEDHAAERLARAAIAEATGAAP